MDKSIPAGAALLLDFIAKPESNGDYRVIFGNHETTLTTPITEMTVDELIKAQHGWGLKWGSSAAGRYQFMPTTLGQLEHQLRLTGSELFSPDLQDRLGFQLLLNRGYAGFMSHALSIEEFAKHLAMEWASLPVLATTQGAHRIVGRGETYYAGDRLNRALVPPDKVEEILTKVRAAAN
jgi:muramidase (phage lysozyme)